MKIVRQCVEQHADGRLPRAGQEGHAAAAARIDESMEALIHHFKLFTEGFKVPAGETYVAIESPRGEIGCYLVSDGTAKPYAHAHPRAVVLQPAVDGRDGARRPRRRRGRDRLEHRPDHGRGRPVMAVHACEPSTARREIIAPLPAAEVGDRCRSLHLAQDQDGWVTPRGDGGDRRARST